MGIQNKKIWLDRRSRKLLTKKRYKFKKRYSSFSKSPIQFNSSENDFIGEYRAVAPSVFSFINNIEETALMFGDLIEAMKSSPYKKRFFFDSSDVENITTDVLVYIIAVIRNMKCNKTKQYTFAGNLPIDMEARKIFEESGLYKYVQTKSGILPSNSEKMQIITGKKTDSLLASQICKFVMEKFNVDKIHIQFLYVTIIELMSNVVHHAYNDKEEIMYPCWYLYAEYNRGKIRFVFVDTGLGIATTVRKRILENFVTNDADLIESAFAGEFRTETKQPNRGLGLPKLKDFATDKKFSDFYVISGNGGYKYKDSGCFEKINLNNKVYGTIYVFEVTRKEIIV